MPDLKSELSKVINEWNDKDMPTNTAPTITLTNGRRITTNSTRTTFNYVRDNPGVTRTDAIVALGKVGIKRSSSTSLISIMVARGNLRMLPNGELFPVQKEYAPLAKPRAAKAVQVSKTPEPVPQPEVVAPTPQDWTVESVIGHLNVRQAMAVYSELRGIFGA